MGMNRDAIAEAAAKAAVLAAFERRRVIGRLAAWLRAVTPPRHDLAIQTLLRHVSTTALDGPLGGRILLLAEFGAQRRTLAA